jgi:transposase
MEVLVERQSALDVHKAQVTACVRLPGPGGERVEHVEQFRTTVQGLLVLRDWLAAHGVRHVVMEATGVYWKPVWHVLEDEFELMLVNARHVKQLPGRKTDVSDAAWLCQLAEAGLLRASFVRGRPKFCVGGFHSGSRSPKWILNASSAVVQFRVLVQAGTALVIAR